MGTLSPILRAKFRLKRPCLHCPFRTDETRLQFATRERAEEIEESAYRRGFPCHETAEVVGDDTGYYMGQDSQHCAGYSIMRLNETDGQPWPGIDNDEDISMALCDQLDFDAPVFMTTDDFLEANSVTYTPVVPGRKMHGWTYRIHLAHNGSARCGSDGQHLTEEPLKVKVTCRRCKKYL